MTLDRRRLLTGMLAASAAQAQSPRPAASPGWHARLGIYCRYSPGNLEFAAKEGFTVIQLAVGPTFGPDLKTAELDKVKENIRNSGLTVVALLQSGNHLDPNPTARARFQDRFARSL